jgi:hypothetical protein
MVLKRKNAFIRQVKDITLSGALTAGLLATSALPLGCGPDRNQTETVYTKGVQTFIREVDWGEFKITDEKVVGEGESKAIVTYLDGRVDTLSLAEARRIVDTPIDSTATQQRQGTSSYGHHHAGLGSALMYGSMGYMLGRSFNQPVSPGVYASPQVFNRSTQHANVVKNSRVARPTNASRGFFRGSSRGASS